MKTAPNMKADLAELIALAARVAGIRPQAVVRGHGRANLEVPARHAVFVLLRERGHTPTEIAEAFNSSRNGVTCNIRRAKVDGSPAQSIVQSIRLHLSVAEMPHDPATPAQMMLKQKFGSPRAYAQRCVNAIGELPAKLAIGAAENYRKRWEEAV